MQILLILIIAGLALLSLGSPDKMKQARTDISNLVQHLPEQVAQAADEPLEEEVTSSKAAHTLGAPDFSNVGNQADIPASSVLGDTAITPSTELASAKYTATEIKPVSRAYQDTHTMDEIHDANVEALRILDRISSDYK